MSTAAEAAAVDDSKAIKTMKLYTHMDRIVNELQALNIAPDAPLTVDILSQFDSLHYLGNTAIDHAIQACQITSLSSSSSTQPYTVLDLGSGVGGTARYLADKTGCHVDALELQPDLSVAGQELTKRCGLSDKVQHLAGNVLEMDLPAAKYNALVSFLVFLHIADRTTLLQKCFGTLQSGATLYVEDFYQRNPFTAEEGQMLRDDVYVTQLPTWTDMTQQLEQAGFVNITVKDMTREWTTYVTERTQAYKDNLTRHEQVHGKEGAQGLSHFYGVMSK